MDGDTTLRGLCLLFCLLFFLLLGPSWMATRFFLLFNLPASFPATSPTLARSKLWKTLPTAPLFLNLGVFVVNRGGYDDAKLRFVGV